MRAGMLAIENGHTLSRFGEMINRQIKSEAVTLVHTFFWRDCNQQFVPKRILFQYKTTK